jgi:hypothetical protein
MDQWTEQMRRTPMTEQRDDLRAMLKAIHDGDPEDIYQCTHKFYRDVQRVRNGYSQVMQDRADLAEVCNEFADGLQERLQQIVKIATQRHGHPIRRAAVSVARSVQTSNAPTISHAGDSSPQT